MKYAIIESGGKQYVVQEGKAIEVDRLPKEIGDKIAWKEVLLFVDDSKVTVGSPHVVGASVEGKVVAQIKGQKILVFKYIPKQRYRRRRGHRQQYTRILIDKVGMPSAKKASEPSPEEAKTEPATSKRIQASEAEVKVKKESSVSTTKKASAEGKAAKDAGKAAPKVKPTTKKTSDSKKAGVSTSGKKTSQTTKKTGAKSEKKPSTAKKSEKKPGTAKKTSSKSGKSSSKSSKK